MYDRTITPLLSPQRLEAAQRAIATKTDGGDSDDQLAELKQRLLLLEEGYEQQITKLKEQYEEALSCHPGSSCDELVRQKYQQEIEQLRVRSCDHRLQSVAIRFPLNFIKVIRKEQRYR